MSLSESYPDIRPVWMNDYANAGVIDPRCSFTRSDSTPSNVHYWSNEDHVSSENLIPKSDPSQSWQKIRTLRTTSGSFLNGSDSHLVSESSETGAHYIAPNTGVGNSTDFTSGTEYTAVLYAKSGTDDILQLAFPSSRFGTNVYANYDLSNASTTPVTGSGATATITELGSGWVKLTLVGTCTSSGIALGFVVGFVQNDINGARLPSYVGDTASNVYIWEGNVSSVGQKFLVETDGQIHREYAATLKPVAYSGQPRFEYEPTGDRSAKGLLIEGQSQNLLGSSEDFSTSWQIINATKELAAIAPNGSLNAIAFREGTNSDQKRLLRYFGNVGPSVTISVYAKLLGNTRRLVIREANATARTDWFDLASGTSGGGAIEAVGNGWYRCSLSFTSSSTPMAAGFYIVPADGTSYTQSEFAGDGYSGLLLAHPQAENQLFASSYIQTPSGVSSSTRTRDQLSVATADIGFEGGPLSLFCEGTAQNENTGGGKALLGVYKNDDNRMAIWTRRNNNRIGFVEGGGVAGNLNESSSYDGKTALSLTTDSFSGSINGRTVLTDTSQPLPDLDGATVYVGNLDSGTAYQINGHIKRVALYSEALTDTELQSLTS